MDGLQEQLLVHCKKRDAIFFPYFPNFKQLHVQLDNLDLIHFFFQ